MKFESSAYYDSGQFLKIEKPFGTFYFGEKFVLSEMREGVHFDWSKVKDLMVDVTSHYKKDTKLAYISNRIYSYSRDPHNWNKFFEKNSVVATAIVIYSHLAYMNATLEKRFSEKSIKRCESLDEAIEWVLNLKEFN